MVYDCVQRSVLIVCAQTGKGVGGLRGEGRALPRLDTIGGSRSEKQAKVVSKYLPSQKSVLFCGGGLGLGEAKGQVGESSPKLDTMVVNVLEDKRDKHCL